MTCFDLSSYPKGILLDSKVIHIYSSQPGETILKFWSLYKSQFKSCNRLIFSDFTIQWNDLLYLLSYPYYLRNVYHWTFWNMNCWNFGPVDIPKLPLQQCALEIEACRMNLEDNVWTSWYFE